MPAYLAIFGMCSASSGDLDTHYGIYLQQSKTTTHIFLGNLIDKSIVYSLFKEMGLFNLKMIILVVGIEFSFERKCIVVSSTNIVVSSTKVVVLMDSLSKINGDGKWNKNLDKDMS